MERNYFQVHETPEASVLELSLPASMDALEFDQINDVVLGEFNGRAANRWIIDLTHVTYMGSAMLGLMVNLRQRIKSAGGRLVLANMSPRLVEVFHACCMEQLFTIAKTKNDALRMLK